MSAASTPATRSVSSRSSADRPHARANARLLAWSEWLMVVPCAGGAPRAATECGELRDGVSDAVISHFRLGGDSAARRRGCAHLVGVIRAQNRARAQLLEVMLSARAKVDVSSARALSSIFGSTVSSGWAPGPTRRLEKQTAPRYVPQSSRTGLYSDMFTDTAS